jgi:hypothetical protein
MHDEPVDLLGRARRAVELGDYAEAQALATIALADAGDELTAWVAHVHEDLEGVGEQLEQAQLAYWAEEIKVAIGVLGIDLTQKRPRSQ